MNWLNIHTDTLRSSEFLGAEPLERATWLALLGWCATQENSGVIGGAKEWTDRRWQQTCGVTKHEAETTSDLYYFEGDSLVVNYYPVEKQAEVVAKREAGKRGGRPRKPLQTQGEKPSGKPCGLGELNLEGELSKSEAETEGKGREGKEKGIEEDIVGSEDPLELIWNNAPKKARERSSRKQLKTEWGKIKDKPSSDRLQDALNSWNKSQKWVDGFAEGIHRWIKNEQWFDLPEPKQEESAPNWNPVP
jgi:hypothetical protein